MKKIFLLLTAAVFSFAVTPSQANAPKNVAQMGGVKGQGRGQQRTPEQRADAQTQQLTTQLRLSADQQTKVRAIFLAQAKEAAGGRSERGQKMQEKRTRNDAQLKTVLTAEQYTKYQQQRQERPKGKRKSQAD